MLNSLLGIFLCIILLIAAFKVGFVILKIFLGLLGIVLLIVLTPLFVPIVALGIGVIFTAAIPILIIGIIIMAVKLIF